MAKQISVKYWPAVVIIIVSMLPPAGFYELARTMPCLCTVVVHGAAIVAVVLQHFCPVAGIEASLCSCVCGGLKVFDVLLQIGRAVKPLIYAATV